MNQTSAHHIFTGQEIAMGYALSAERIFNNDRDYLQQNLSIIPIFVSLLFQSVEIAIKYMGIEAGLFTVQEARDKSMGRGHGITQLAALASERIGGPPYFPIIIALTHFNNKSHATIELMICDPSFEKTRECYASRCLGYGQVAEGDFSYVEDIELWIRSVKETAGNLHKGISFLKNRRRNRMLLLGKQL